MSPDALFRRGLPDVATEGRPRHTRSASKLGMGEIMRGCEFEEVAATPTSSNPDSTTVIYLGIGLTDLNEEIDFAPPRKRSSELGLNSFVPQGYLNLHFLDLQMNGAVLSVKREFRRSGPQRTKREPGVDLIMTLYLDFVHHYLRHIQSQ